MPALSEAGSLLDANSQRLRQSTRLLGRPLVELRQLARHDALRLATEYLTEAGERVPVLTSDRLVVAGHQPELFHPGVWIKSFALFGLGRRHGLVSLNVIVDNDVAKVHDLRLPLAASAGDLDGPLARIHRVPFDRRHEVPYEERTVKDESIFAGFAEQATQLTRDWNWRPMLPDFWQEARRQGARTALLGERLAAARRTWERRWDCHNLEVPLSRLCRTETFAWFACHILCHLPAFHQHHNDIVRDYRRRHGLRSTNHPVPDLAAAGDALEAPFWVWRAGYPRRQRLLVRDAGAHWTLQAAGERWLLAKGEAGVADFRELQTAGVKIRPRALTTTLFLRLMLADLLLHGIGGGKYDEIADELWRRFFRIAPPHFLILSATLLLPFQRYPIDVTTCHAHARFARDLHYNPQRHFDIIPAEAAALVREKQAWIERDADSAAQRLLRFQTLRKINERLRPLLGAKLRETVRQASLCQRQLEANAVLARRDYVFCLYPEEKLRPFCRRFLDLP